MPKFDKTGPAGSGPLTGARRGSCGQDGAQPSGDKCGVGRGSGRGQRLGARRGGQCCPDGHGGRERGYGRRGGRRAHRELAGRSRARIEAQLDQIIACLGALPKEDSAGE